MVTLLILNIPKLYYCSYTKALNLNSSLEAAWSNKGYAYY